MKPGLIHGGIITLACCVLIQSAFAQTALIPAGAVWKYLDNGSDQTVAWQARDYDDGFWAMGPAPLGYGDGGEATTNSYGVDPNNKYITTYYRHSFNVVNPASFTNLSLRLLRDDGGAVYLNGVEVFRSNLPTNEIMFQTLASTNVAAGDESTNFYATAINPAMLVNNTNVLAVEIHQVSTNSTDMSFDLSLTGNYIPVRPSVALTAPASGAVLSRGNVTLYAAAGDNLGSVVRVDFFGNGSKLGEDSTAPYSLTWPNIPLGSHTFTAVAINNSGLSATSAPVAITILPALIHSGAEWKYLDDGSNQDVAWRNLIFDDSGWSNGVAELGYGDGGEGTSIGGGPDINGIITATNTYFRHVFEVADPSAFSNLVVRLLRDDGGIVYLNGTEIFRSNMRSGPASYTDFSASIINVPQESQFYATNVPLGLLQAGPNVVAVEIHQGNSTSSDLSFNLELLPNIAPTAPVVSISSPTNNIVFAGPTNVTVLAAATDFDGTIARVDFLVGGTVLGTDASEPYSLTVSNVPFGNYQVQAVAADHSGIMVTSAPVSITVLSPPLISSLIATGATWRYLDDGSNQGTAWVAGGFNDSGWPVGAAKFGTNDPGNNTLIRIGASNVTTYFRNYFWVDSPYIYTNLAFRVLRDDGVVAYLNGAEIFRMNMPTGIVTYATVVLASQVVGGSNETNYFATNITPALLISGTNVLAVELHQTAGTTDAGFDLSLLGVGTSEPPLSLTIQRSPANITIQWTADGAVLQRANTLGGSWSNVVPAASSPYLVNPAGAGGFYRLRRP